MTQGLIDVLDWQGVSQAAGICAGNKKKDSKQF
jgi:hypothetical protein